MSKQISPQTKKYWIRWHSHAAYHASLTKENEYPHRTRKWEGRVGRKLMMQKRWNRVNCHCLFEILSLFCVCCSSRYSSTCSLSQIWYLFHTPHIARSSNKNADTRTKRNKRMLWAIRRVLTCLNDNKGSFEMNANSECPEKYQLWSNGHFHERKLIQYCNIPCHWL